MKNSTDAFIDEFWIALYPLAGEATTNPSDNVSNEGPKISPVLVFFLFIVLDAFIIGIFYFCYFMRTKSVKPRTDQVQDKPPPYQIAVLENIYPPVPPQDEESGSGDLPSYDDTIIKNTNLNLPQTHASDSIDMTIKMT